MGAGFLNCLMVAPMIGLCLIVKPHLPRAKAIDPGDLGKMKILGVGWVGFFLEEQIPSV